MIRRNIQERGRTIVPFLRLDHDPYLVISDGRLFWMQDAYTTSDYFPYAQPVQGLRLNYIRNSAKVVVDAYNGTVDFYLIDSVDPIAASYQRIFPGLFKPFAAMPGGLQKHIRYPAFDQRTSVRTLRPSVQSNCFRPCTNAAMQAVASRSSAAPNMSTTRYSNLDVHKLNVRSKNRLPYNQNSRCR